MPPGAVPIVQQPVSRPGAHAGASSASQLEAIKRKSDELLRALSSASDPAATSQLSAAVATAAGQHLAGLAQSWPQVQAILQEVAQRHQAGALKPAFEAALQRQHASEVAGRSAAWCSSALEELELCLQHEYAPLLLRRWAAARGWGQGAGCRIGPGPGPSRSLQCCPQGAAWEPPVPPLLLGMPARLERPASPAHAPHPPACLQPCALARGAQLGARG